jgi:hypothetical protein
MTKFRKGLSEKFVAALNTEYDQGNWWRSIMSDRDLYLGIRDDSLNVYYKGNSLLRLRLAGEVLQAEVHYKYLLHPEAKPTYIEFTGGRRAGRLGDDLFLNALDPAFLKLASTWYAREEKQAVHEILRSNPNIVDVEIALAGGREGSDRQSAKRIDFAAIQPRDNGLQLVFFEAKHFANLELRASGEAIPSVIRQIRGYEKLLSDHQADIEKTYRIVCENLCKLHGVREEVKALAERVVSGTPFSVNLLPRLVIFGFDDDQKNGKVWSVHRAKLEDGTNGLGAGRVLLRGSAKGFCKGIGYPSA